MKWWYPDWAGGTHDCVKKIENKLLMTSLSPTLIVSTGVWNLQNPVNPGVGYWGILPGNFQSQPTLDRNLASSPSPLRGVGPKIAGRLYCTTI